MAGCTEGRHLRLLAIAACALQACATGNLFEAGRLTETAHRYEAAYSDGERLWIVYEARTWDAEGHEVARQRRAASLALADLAGGYPLDAFPLARVSTERVPSAALEPLALFIRADGSAPPAGARGLLVEVAGERHESFVPLRLAALPADTRFYSGALVRRRTAPWVYAALPLTVTFDLVSLAILLPPAIPLFAPGD